MPQKTPLLPLVRRYFETDPVTAARMLETLKEEEAAQVLKALPPSLAAQAVKGLQVSHAATLLKDAEVELVQEIFQALDGQHAATILMHLPPAARERAIAHIPEKLRQQTQEFLQFPEGSVGRVMSTSFLCFRSHIKVRDVIERIRALAQKRFPSSYAYVIDDQDRLVGVMNMRDLMLAAPSATLASVMRTEIFSLEGFMSLEQAARELSKRRYFAAPVVDSQQRILGVIKAEHLLHDVQEEVTEDIQKMFGVGADERPFSSLGFSLRKRLPWLHVNLATAFLAAAVVAMFEDVIARITVLAVFLPVVAGQGGNAGAQSLAIVMRGLVMREIPKERIKQLVWKEAWLGAINGLVIGLVTAVIAWLWQGNPFLGVVIGLGMLVNLICAGLAGTVIPLVMKAMGLDPAQCSNIVLTTVTDVVGFFAFLGFAVIFQDYLV